MDTEPEIKTEAEAPAKEAEPVVAVEVTKVAPAKADESAAQAMQSLLDRFTSGDESVEPAELIREMASKLKELTSKAGDLDEIVNERHSAKRASAFDKDHPEVSGKYKEVYDHACAHADKECAGKSSDAWEYAAKRAFDEKLAELKKASAVPAKQEPKAPDMIMDKKPDLDVSRSTKSKPTVDSLLSELRASMRTS